MSSLRSLAVAVSFLTRIPVRNEKTEAVDFGRSVAWFPAIGLGIGVFLIGAELLLRTRVGPELRAVVLVALCAVVSGGLHLDGLADTFDAVGGGRGDRVRMLAIMKDSQIGAHGATALVLALVAKVLAVVEVLGVGDFWPILAWPAVGRWAVVPLIVFFPYARNEGLGKAFSCHARAWHLLVATGLLVMAIAGLISVAWPALLAAAAVSLGLGLWMHKRLAGLTGDVYGAVIELAEITFLIIVASSISSR